MRRPELFLLGAPKCGTTTLYEWLNSHDDVFMPSVKEPHFYSSPYGSPMSEEIYLSLFRKARRVQYCGDASVFYLYNVESVRRIISSVDNPKFVVCIRNPMEMAPSLHAQKYFTGHERIQSYDEAWDLRHERLSGSLVGTYGIQDGDPKHMSYGFICRLGSQLRELLTIVPQSLVHVVVLDDLRNDPAEEWLRLQQFLGLQIEPLPQLKIANPATKRRYQGLHHLLHSLYVCKQRVFPNVATGVFRKISRLNTVVEKYEGPSDRVKLEMLEEFSPEIDLVSELLNKDYSYWK